MKKNLLLCAFFLLLTIQLRAQCGITDSLERVLVNLPDSPSKVNVMNRLAEEYALIRNKQNTSYLYAKRAITLAIQLNYPKGEAQALVNQAKIAYDVNPQLFDEVIASLNKALRLFDKLQDKHKQAEVMKTYGRFYYKISYSKKEYLDSAAKYFVKSHEAFEKLGDTKESGESAGLAAEVYFEKGDDKKALEFSKKSIVDDTSYSNAAVIQKSLERRIGVEAAFRNVLIAGFVLLGLFSVLVAYAFAQSRRSNIILKQQKADLALKNEEINKQKAEIEKNSLQLQEANKSLELRSKEIVRQNKEILLQGAEIEMRNAELNEKNEELKQQQEEILSQRDNLEKQALELEEKADELQKSHETITILSRIGQSITSTLDFKEIFDTLYGYITQLMPAEGFRILQYHLEQKELEYKLNIENTERRPLMRIPLSDESNPAVVCVKNMRSILVNNKRSLSNYGLDEYSINRVYNSMLYYPLIQEGHVIGAIGVYAKKENAYNQHHLDTIKTLATYTTIAFKNAETYEILNAAQAQLVESEKMAALGNLVAGVAHEINTPIGICVTASSRIGSKTKEFADIYNSGQMKRKDLSEYLATVEEGNKIILTNISRAADLVQSFKRVAVEQTSETKRPFNLKTYLAETIMALNPELKNKPYHIELDADEIEINSYAGAFSQIITNLVMNSLIHGFKNRESGVMTIRAKTKQKNLILTYSDDGNGMTPEVVSKVFEPFFTTNRDGGGTGLGMNIVYNLTVQKLGGKLNVESTVGKGVLFTFEIPLNL